MPLLDKVQDKLANSEIFSTLNLKCGYWLFLVYPDDCHKTAFYPGSDMGLFQFIFGLTGDHSSYQRMLKLIVLRITFVTVYSDNILIDSVHKSQHAQHLCQVFELLNKANLTLRGSKCHLAMSEVFSVTGMSPDHQKVVTVNERQSPCNAEVVQKFLVLASYYCCYIPGFS